MIKITNKADCTGCTACYSICPKSSIIMVEDKEGFKYPHVSDDTCIDCGLCEKICPIINNDRSKKNVVINAYAAHYINCEVWYKSSSGGAFTAVTDYIYANNGVAFGASYNKKFEIIHDIAETKEDAIKFRGSKYAQSNLGDIFKDVKSKLVGGRLVLFSGTPCQVAGLKSYLRRDYENLLTVDLICHCVPSPLVFRDYIQYIERKYAKNIIHINMKDKTKGWPVQSPRICFDDGSSLFDVKDSYLWGSIFYSYLAIRPSCHECRFSNLHRESDITIGDYWGVEKFHPEYNSPNGASIVLINTQKGELAFSKISSYLEYTSTDVVKALPKTLLYSTIPNKKRARFWKDYYRLSFGDVCKKYLEPSYTDRLRNTIYRHLISRPIRFIKRIRNRK